MQFQDLRHLKSGLAELIFDRLVAPKAQQEFYRPRATAEARIIRGRPKSPAAFGSAPILTASMTSSQFSENDGS